MLENSAILGRVVGQVVEVALPAAAGRNQPIHFEFNGQRLTTSCQEALPSGAILAVRIPEGPVDHAALGVSAEDV